MAEKEVILLIVFSSIFVLLILLFVVFVLFSNYKKGRLYRESLVKVEYEKQQEVLKARLEIQEQTFRNISQEIHDNIGQVLSLVKLNLSSLEMAGPGPSGEIIAISKQLLSKAIQDMRNISHSINSDYIAEMGLEKAIESELKLIDKSLAYETTFSVYGTPFALDKQKELILFRMVQETLQNILKHANGTAIIVTVTYSAEGLEVTIKDDGAGFDMERLQSGHGFGLGILSMKNRAAIINAAFNIQSSAGNGTTVTVMVNN